MQLEHLLGNILIKADFRNMIRPLTLNYRLTCSKPINTFAHSIFLVTIRSGLPSSEEIVICVKDDDGKCDKFLALSP